MKVLEKTIHQIKNQVVDSYWKDTPIGYFAMLYLQVTCRVRNAIVNGEFENPKKMEKLDRTFAGRYLTAIAMWKEGKQFSKTWNIAFNAANSNDLLVIQHLLLACNAHIQIDLGAAVATAWRGEDLTKLHGDFNKINTILKGAFDELEAELKQIWRPYRIIDTLFGFFDEMLVNAVMRYERDHAWEFANELIKLPPKKMQKAIDAKDEEVAKLSEWIKDPGFFFNLIKQAIVLTEIKDPRTVIKIMAERGDHDKSFDPSKGFEKKKVAIFGGGPAGLAAAYGITSDPEWKKRFDVTIYSLGWRLGGKGATGRAPEYGYRIEEHGLHMWFGFYENSFKMMREVYKELDRPPSHPLPTFEKAFIGQDTYAFYHEWNGKPYLWHIEMPQHQNAPGDEHPPATLWDVFFAGFQSFLYLYRTKALEGKAKEGTPLSFGEKVLREAFDIVEAVFNNAEFTPEEAIEKVDALLEFIEDPLDLHPDDKDRFEKLIIKIATGIREDIRKTFGPKIDTDLIAYRAYISLDIIATIVIGTMKDEVLKNGFASIDKYEWLEWLNLHGLSETTAKSCMIQVAYDSSFGFYKNVPDMEAGETLIGAFFMFFGYKGSLVYKFAAGTGESVIEPVYEALKRRGVNFELFHRVKEIKSSKKDSKTFIDEIIVDHQMKPKNGSYDPTIDVKGLKCWPNKPKFDELIDGDKLKESGQNLESFWSTWEGEIKSLKRGSDFDEVILAMSHAGMKYMGDSLRDNVEPWGPMLDNIQTTRTQAFQLWLKKDIQQLGWPLNEAIVSCYGEPINSWADVSENAHFEDWSADKSQEPVAVEYYCGLMDNTPYEIPPHSDKSYPPNQHEYTVGMTRDFIEKKLIHTLPKAFNEDGTFQWELISDPKDRKGAERLGAVYMRANLDPSERYVLSVKGSGQYRMKNDGNLYGMGNVYLAGDWTDNGFCNAGYMEGAIMSGLQAAQALSGFPRVIAHENVDLEN